MDVKDSGGTDLHQRDGAAREDQQPRVRADARPVLVAGEQWRRGEKQFDGVVMVSLASVVGSPAIWSVAGQ